MDSTATTPDTSYTAPWTVRAYDALPGNPLRIGIALTLGLLLVYFVGRALVGAAGSSTADDLRIAITQILMTTYSVSAYAYLLMSVRKTTQDLSPVAQHLPQWHVTLDRAGKHPRWLLPLVGAANFLIIGVAATNATTPDSVNPWAWQTWNYDVYWHRATSVLFVWWIGCLCYVAVAESARLSRMSDTIESLDLLDLGSYQPLIRQGLTNALLVIGVVSILSLLAVESRYGPMLVTFWIAFIVLAWIGMMLPLAGSASRLPGMR
jgi:hypothetical protein